MMAKVDCGNTPVAEPLFPFLCQKVPPAGFLSSLTGIGLKWNFTKFLCDKDGKPVKRFEPSVNPLDFEQDIVDLLIPQSSSPSNVPNNVVAAPAPATTSTTNDNSESST
mmetsp:Transcript_16205/g.16936  ORF Transcript_16205/g.16936 Transcript_16205/m.16936 type:complete len:109 (-) Transcript_16205:300-626(-)